MQKILIVEDEPNNRDLAETVLARRGYDVRCAEDGVQALRSVEAEHPDLILMDLSLPCLDGWEVTRRLRGDERFKHIPIVALTAFAMQGDREKALEAGADDYLTKPYRFDDLLSTVERHLGADNLQAS